MMTSLVFWSLFWSINASLVALPSSFITPAARGPGTLERRQTTAPEETCGYSNGNSQFPRMAGPGYFCGEDSTNNLWGFCLDTVAVADCGLSGYCVDNGACSTGCGVPGLTSVSCSQSYCYSEFLVSNDQTFTYITCANSPGSALFFAVPITSFASASMFSSSSQAIVVISTLERTVTMTSIPSATDSLPSTFASASSQAAEIISTLDKTVIVTSPLSSATAPVISSHTKFTASSRSTSPAPAASSSTSVISTNTKSTPDRMPIGAIIGGSLGGLTLILLTIISFIILKRRYIPTPKAGGHDPTGELNAVVDSSQICETHNGQHARCASGLPGLNDIWKTNDGASSRDFREDSEVGPSELGVGR